MDTYRQFTVFCFCIATGFIGGIIYEPFSFVRFLLKRPIRISKIIGIIADVLFCLCFAMLCVYMSYKLHFGAFRMYMCMGYGLGFIIYLKTLVI